jgi:hypothetical protein
MRIVPLAIMLGFALVLGFAIWHFSNLPLWGAALISALAVAANIAIAKVEDNEPGGINNPDAPPPARGYGYRTIRVLGTLVGLAFVGGGVLMILQPLSSEGWWRTYLPPASMILTGIYFTNYGVTGRSTLLRRQKGAWPE